MYQLVQTVIQTDEVVDLRQVIGQLRDYEKKMFLRTEILQIFGDYCHHVQKPTYFYRSSSLGELLHYTHEILLEENNVWLLLRPKMASQVVYRLTMDCTQFEIMSSQALLNLRDRLVNRYQPQLLEIDLTAFYQNSPTIGDLRNIGKGLEFLNRYLCQEEFNNRQDWLEAIYQALHKRNYKGMPQNMSRKYPKRIGTA